MNYTQLRIEEVKKAGEIKALAKTEGRAMTEDDLTKIDAHLDKAQEYAVLAEKEKKTEERMKAVNADLDKAITKTATQPLAGSVEVGDPEWTKDPNFGYRTPAIFLKEVLAVGRGRKPSAQLEFLAVLGSDEQKTINDSDGGFLVPRGFLATLLKVDPEMDPTIGLTMQVPMESPSVSIPARTDKDHTNSVAGGVQFFRRGETQPGKDTKIEFEQVKLEANSLVGISFQTEEIIMDSAISFAAIVSQAFNDARMDKLFREKIDGVGVAGFEGVTNSGSFISIPKEVGQTPDTINHANVLNMRARSWGYRNAIWLSNLDTQPSISKIQDPEGHLIWHERIDVDHPEMLLGRPIFFTEYTETLGDANDIILCNWSQYLEGTLQPMQTSESIHVRFVQLQRTFRFFERNDARAWWKSPLTPVKGANTLSPFLGLAERA